MILKKWTSGNKAIDKFIQNAQLDDKNYKVIEWMPYDRSKVIKPITTDNLSTIIMLSRMMEKFENGILKVNRR